MEYALGIDDRTESIDGGTGLLLFHPSTGETDRVDTDFFASDTDAFLVISTRTTAREVEQKLEYYDVDESKATILDTLSVERGYSRRGGDGIHYVASPDDLDGIIEHTRRFLAENDGKRRISIDSVTELAYYAEDDDAVFEAMVRLHELLAEYDAVGLFHISPEVHDQSFVERYRQQFDMAIHLNEAGELRIER